MEQQRLSEEDMKKAIILFQRTKERQALRKYTPEQMERRNQNAKFYYSLHKDEINLRKKAEKIKRDEKKQAHITEK